MILAGHGRTVDIAWDDDTDHIARRIAEASDFYERALLDDCYQRAPEGLIVDAGAHIGNHTLFFAGIMGREVVAFEPYLPSFRQLEANISRNDLGHYVQTLMLALGAKKGYCTVGKPGENNSGSAQVVYGTGNVMVVALDDLDLSKVAVIKCDVEGSALAVLQGARATLERCRPLLYVETAKAHKDVEKMLAPLGYSNKGWYGATATHVYEAA